MIAATLDVCPDPTGCPVVDALPELTHTTITQGTRLFRAHGAPWGYDEFNPGGNARFSPFDLPTLSGVGARVPAMYLAADPTAALLESVFHDIDPARPDPADRIIYSETLINTLLSYLSVPADAVLADLRDPELARLGVRRSQVVSSPGEHYPCTRRLAVQVLSRLNDGVYVDGMIWHSRKAELIGEEAEVMVLFGHRYVPKRGRWPLSAPGVQNLWEGAGRTLVDRIASRLHATVV